MDQSAVLAEIFSVFRKIPYENISKIFRLPLAPSDRIEKDSELFLNHYRNGWGGTCFSMTWAALKLMKDAGIKAHAVHAPMQRQTFPHYALVYELEEVSYFFDPGYMIFEGVPMDPENVGRYTNGVLNYELSHDPDSGLYAMHSVPPGQKILRYRIDPHPVDKDSFREVWQKSFEYIDQTVLSGISGHRFIFVHGDYAQIRTRNSIEKYEGRDKVRRILYQYFPFSREELDTAEQILQRMGDSDGLTG